MICICHDIPTPHKLTQTKGIEPIFLCNCKPVFSLVIELKLERHSKAQYLKCILFHYRLLNQVSWKHMKILGQPVVQAKLYGLPPLQCSQPNQIYKTKSQLKYFKVIIHLLYIFCIYVFKLRCVNKLNPLFKAYVSFISRAWIGLKVRSYKGKHSYSYSFICV